VRPIPLLKSVVKRTIQRALLYGWFRSRQFTYGKPASTDTVVIMCLWNRPSRLNYVLQRLDAQTDGNGIQLYLWNNAKKDHEHYIAELERFTAQGTLTAAHIVKTPYNLGSIARFYWARKLAKRLGAGPMIVIDDDENFDTTFVSEALSQYDPRVLTGWWAWTMGAGYWDRAPAALGDRVDHIGPGGMICDRSVFLDDRFFTRMPLRYWVLDDLWLSYFATETGYSLGKLDVAIEFVMDETNQHHDLGDLKREFYDVLRSDHSPLA